MQGITLHRQESLSDAPIIDSLPLVLVVEDDDTIRDLLILLLVEEQSYHVLSASSGERALQMLASSPRPDLLLLDYMLPGMNGITLYDQVCTRFGWRDIPALLVSAALPEQEVEQRSLIGVAKPFDIDTLLTLVEQNIHKGIGTNSSFL